MLNYVQDHDVISLQDMDMQQLDSGSCLSGTTSKTEENILVAIFGPRTEHLISQIHLPICPLPVAPYLLHASPQKSPPPSKFSHVFCCLCTNPQNICEGVTTNAAQK